MMEHAVCVEKLYNAAAGLGEEGRAAVDFLRSRRTKVGFKKVSPNIGAFWTVFGNICLNSRYYSYQTPLDDLRIKTLIISTSRKRVIGAAEGV